MSAADGGSANPYISPIMAIPETKTPAAGRAVARGDHVYLIDGSGYIFRAYHALPPLTRPSDGLPVGAVHGFCGMLWKLLRETGELDAADAYRGDFRLSEQDLPQRICTPTTRRTGRSRRTTSSRNFRWCATPCAPSTSPASRCEGYEADDLIATYAREAAEAGAEVTIVSSDKDLMQLVRPGVRMYDTMKNKRDRRGRGDRALRRAAVQGRRGAVADRRFLGQRAGRARDRGQDRRPAHQRIRRSRNAARPRRRRSSRTNGARASSLSPTRRGCRRRW